MKAATVTAVPQAEAQRLRMSLAAVTRGRQARPFRVALYSAEGLGKSTFASQAPSPIFIEPDAGSGHLDVARFPKPETWDEIVQAVVTLATEAHDFKTVVIDTLDAAEPLLWRKLCEAQGVASVEEVSGGFGKGYVAAVEHWRSLLNDLERLQASRGMNVILLAHMTIKQIHDPGRDSYDRSIMRMHEKSAGAIREWCEDVLFAELDVSTAKDPRTKRVKGFSSGERIMHAQPHAAWYAKSRPSLPETMPLSWTEFVMAKQAGIAAEPEKLIAAITENAARLPEDLQKATNESLERAGKDAVKLAQLDNWVRGKLAATDTE